MPINNAQRKKLFAWLNAKGVREACPACGCAARQVGDILAPPPTPHGGGTVIGGPSFPLVQVICSNCSHVMHFATTPIGLDTYMDRLRQEETVSERPVAAALS